MTNNKKSTRYYSGRQEKEVAKVLKGKVVANSGAIPFGAGDVLADNWLFECKTMTEEHKSFSIKRDWLKKNKEEAFAMGRGFNALVFDFGDGGDRYYVVDERTFKILKEAYENDKAGGV